MAKLKTILAESDRFDSGGKVLQFLLVSLYDGYVYHKICVILYLTSKYTKINHPMPKYLSKLIHNIIYQNIQI